MKIEATLQAICGELDRGEITRDQFVALCTRLMASALGCSRASIGLFVDSAKGVQLQGLGIYDRAEDRMVRVDSAPVPREAYIAALTLDGHVIAEDARTHPATAPFYEQRLEPFGVVSLLAASFSVNGVLFGAFGCTQAGHRRRWTAAELRLLKRIGNRASLSLAEATAAAAALDAPVTEYPPLLPLEKKLDAA